MNTPDGGWRTPPGSGRGLALPPANARVEPSRGSVIAPSPRPDPSTTPVPAATVPMKLRRVSGRWNKCGRPNPSRQWSELISCFDFIALLPNQSSSFVPVRGVRLDPSVRSFPPVRAACRRRGPRLLKREIRQFWIIARRPTLRTPALIVDDQVLRSGRKYLQRLQKLDHVIALL